MALNWDNIVPSPHPRTLGNVGGDCHIDWDPCWHQGQDIKVLQNKELSHPKCKGIPIDRIASNSSIFTIQHVEAQRSELPKVTQQVSPKSKLESSSSGSQFRAFSTFLLNGKGGI